MAFVDTEGGVATMNALFMSKFPSAYPHPSCMKDIIDIGLLLFDKKISSLEWCVAENVSSYCMPKVLELPLLETVIKNADGSYSFGVGATKKRKRCEEIPETQTDPDVSVPSDFMPETLKPYSVEDDVFLQTFDQLSQYYYNMDNDASFQNYFNLIC